MADPIISCPPYCIRHFEFVKSVLCSGRKMHTETSRAILFAQKVQIWRAVLYEKLEFYGQSL